MKNSSLAWILFAAAMILMVAAGPLGLTSKEPQAGMIEVPARRIGTGYVSPIFLALEAILLYSAFYLHRKK